MIEEKDTKMYAAIMNLPGYAPDLDAVYFDTAREAWEFLLSELKKDRDIEIEAGDDPALSEFEHGIQFATESRGWNAVGGVEVDGLIYQVVHIK